MKIAISSPKLVGAIKAEREKVVLEKEVEAAQIVQELFLPKEPLNTNNYSIAAFSVPAAKCGGDWCYYTRFENYLLIYIGDATGHGISQALITATAQSCSSCIEKMLFEKYKSLAIKDDFSVSTSFIMDYFNYAIWRAAGGKINMTFLVMLLNTKTNSISYTNAGHTTPYRINQAGKALPFLGARANYLGASSEQKFIQVKGKIEAGDMLVVYSDGITEAENIKKEQFGKKRLLSSIFQKKDKEIPDILTGVKDEVSGYTKSKFDDDLTLLVCRIKN